MAAIIVIIFLFHQWKMAMMLISVAVALSGCAFVLVFSKDISEFLRIQGSAN